MIDIINSILIVTSLVLIGMLFKKSQPKPVQKAEETLVIDTSALIDGRVVDIAAAGFLPLKLVIAQFVLGELQRIAGLKDPERRERGRAGLTTIKNLQKLPEYRVVLLNTKTSDEPVDHRLVQLCSDTGATLLTLDVALKDIGRMKNVRVLSVNELARLMQPKHKPGEIIRIKVISKGSERQQGVGYSSDGILVVVESGHQFVGRTINVEVLRTLQTETGNMIFARAASNPRRRPPTAPATTPASAPRRRV